MNVFQPNGDRRLQRLRVGAAFAAFHEASGGLLAVSVLAPLPALAQLCAGDAITVSAQNDLTTIPTDVALRDDGALVIVRDRRSDGEALSHDVEVHRFVSLRQVPR